MKRSVLHAILAIALGVAYALYYFSRGAGMVSVVIGIFAALVGGFIVQAFLPPSRGTRD